LQLVITVTEAVFAV